MGQGRVGAPLAEALESLGHEVTRWTRQSSPEQLAGQDVILVAVPFPAVQDVAGAINTHGGTAVVIDCTNPVGPGFTHGLGSQTSGAEHLQALIAQPVVKAFSIYGYEVLSSDPSEWPAPRVMMIAGDDEHGVRLVDRLVTDLGWECLVVGGLAASLHLEHLTLLWVRLVRGGGHPPLLAWHAMATSGA
jgi:predicted dinucleotide-binding enzyme